ncbi:hypothetical protein M0D21_13110 [Aquimarina sp. D1M17]|uniref:hypothetical protein n=1 Tax=Aquimarina acroporae TaxID=2937283 RepID=UPI0020BF80AC|nr:hypothetical protein [Aquimarina acroporae]MCK8522517.1 hypothetical protein [Aquimarina acroporae]
MKNRVNNLIGYPIVAILAALITYFYTKNDPVTQPDPDPTTPEEIISFKDAVQLYRSYSKNRACIIKAFEGRDSLITKLCPTDRKANPEFMPSRSFLLKDTFLEEYIAYVKSITPDSVKITGYRLYLGNYPDADKFVDGKPIPDPRRNTFFIAPTTRSERDGIHKGYTFLDRNNDGKPELIFLEDIIDELRPDGLGNLNQVQQSKINTASFFSFSSALQGGENSTLANEIGGSPPY